jgi:large subunit ribosomal protein L18
MPRKVAPQDRRKARVRLALRSVNHGRVRLSVFRSSKQIYAQIIDDVKGHTVASASSLEKAMRESLKTGANLEAAKAVGKAIAERGVKAGGGVRSWRLSLSRARQGAGRCRPRRRPEVLGRMIKIMPKQK